MQRRPVVCSALCWQAPASRKNAGSRQAAGRDDQGCGYSRAVGESAPNQAAERDRSAQHHLHTASPRALTHAGSDTCLTASGFDMIASEPAPVIRRPGWRPRCAGSRPAFGHGRGHDPPPSTSWSDVIRPRARRAGAAHRAPLRCHDRQTECRKPLAPAPSWLRAINGRRAR